MFEEMRGKTAIITGATSGIGKASAILLASCGIQVAFAGRDEKRGKALENELLSSKAKALFIPTDVANTVLWLFSPMSTHINGENIFVDGGSSVAG